MLPAPRAGPCGVVQHRARGEQPLGAGTPEKVVARVSGGVWGVGPCQFSLSSAALGGPSQCPPDQLFLTPHGWSHRCLPGSSQREGLHSPLCSLLLLGEFQEEVLRTW